MHAPLAIVTGFGPFLSVPVNPSERVAQLLERDPPGNIEVRALELPVSFARVQPCLDTFLADLPRRPTVLLGLGAHRKGYFRLENRARRILDSTKPDNDGQFAAEVAPLGERDLLTSFDLDHLAQTLTEPTLESVMISQQAGGFVCERTYHALLEAGDRLNVPALFLHVPPAEFLTPELQAPHVRELLAAMVSAAEQRPG